LRAEVSKVYHRRDGFHDCYTGVTLFTGLVEDMGRIERADRRGDAVELEIAPDTIDPAELSLGESVAIDGVCLTVTKLEGRRFRVLAGPETLRLTTTGAHRVGTRVNLERALKASDRLGGHVVAGHVDGVGEIASKRSIGPAVEIQFRAPRELLRYVVQKGSIAVDGISLTVNRVDEYSFAVGLIPHTLQKTTLGDKHVGSRVNLEVDILGKYVEKFVKEHLSR
jgi:riboflavin synthase